MPSSVRPVMWLALWLAAAFLGRPVLRAEGEADEGVAGTAGGDQESGPSRGARLDDDIPSRGPVYLPEHPRPDFERSEWKNLNGSWPFRFDPKDEGEKGRWFEKNLREWKLDIKVPFPWGSKLSGVPDGAVIGWYAKALANLERWRGRRVFLCFGASDWETKAWLNGKPVGVHRGGYTPFEFELTPQLKYSVERLVVRVDDAPRPFKLEGKQGYGNARGIWQTVWLESRPKLFLRSIHFRPDLDAARVEVTVAVSEPAPADLPLLLEFRDRTIGGHRFTIPRGQEGARFEVAIPRPRPWSPRDPYLYEVEASLGARDLERDHVSTYFGLRKISVAKLPGTEFPYIALNNEPFYLQIALDQCYHPDGFYTFPSDEFLRDEILRSLRLGLNAVRLHVKMEMPRKLYWADRLGLLLMADVPNSWGEPTTEMRGEAEAALRGMIERDFNHPSIFSWVVFNETWGLFSGKGKDRAYLPETQGWVKSMYRLAKELDPSRLVEDNSPCNYDHVETDINSWHNYLPGYAWRETLDQITRDTAPGSPWNFAKGFAQGAAPLLNSECGNVWGYDGSTGDVDWSWDYHLMMNEFRRHPKVCGWLYTEHHDVINEWNGYYRFDRSEKFTGFEELAPGMTLRDLHGPFYISTGSDLCREAKPGEKVEVPLFASFLTATAPSPALTLRTGGSEWDRLGVARRLAGAEIEIPFSPYLARELPPITVAMPERSGLVVLTLELADATGAVLHRNFTTFLVTDGPAPRDETLELGGKHARAIRFAPASFQKAEWSHGQWNILDGLKVNGAGSGFFEYRLPWPAGLDPEKISGASFRAEVSAKELFAKDRKDTGKVEGDFMRGKGTVDPALNPNAYPMTDTVKYPSDVRVRLGETALGRFELEDDPADSRGILSWHAQPRDKKLREAGSYGYLLNAAIPVEALRAAAKAGEIVLGLEVDGALPGGLAIYGERFGRYPLDPTILFEMKE